MVEALLNCASNAQPPLLPSVAPIFWASTAWEAGYDPASFLYRPAANDITPVNPRLAAQGLAFLMSYPYEASDSGVVSNFTGKRLSVTPFMPKVRVLGWPSVKKSITFNEAVSFFVTICWYAVQ